jgi:hypothetical protein
MSVVNSTTVFDDATIDQLHGGNSKDFVLARTSGPYAGILDADDLIQSI